MNNNDITTNEILIVIAIVLWVLAAISPVFSSEKYPWAGSSLVPAGLAFFGAAFLI